MNLTPRWVGALEAAGLRAEHWSTVGRADAPDRDIIQYARDHGRVVITHDLDFTTILALTSWDKPSVV
jgi:predicted nuclease of predicted toxin-antitoxin system